MEENKPDTKNEILPDVKNIKSQATFTLPSKGLIYNPEDNIPASITLRRMTTKEEKMRLRNESEDRIRRDILNACIIEDVDAGKLKLEDANYLLFQLRVLSLLDDKYKVQCTCRECGTTFIHELNLSEIPVTYFAKKTLSLFETTLPISQNKITFKLPSIDNIINMSDKVRAYIDRFPNVDRGELVYILSVVLYIDKVNGNILISDELEEYVNNLDILDARHIKNIINTIDNSYGYLNDIKTLCPKCKAEFTHGLPITGELFDPSN